MATEKQYTANIANAQQSTGPRTPDGKAASAQNARKHGLSSKYLPLSDLEKPHFDQLEADLRAEINPKGPLQESIFRELAAAAWKRDAVNRLLAETAPSTDDMLLAHPETEDRLRKLQRHKNDADRSFNRALRQLKDLQTTEMLRSTALHAQQQRNPALNPKTFPGLADYARVAKQSQFCAKNTPSPAQQFTSTLQNEANSVEDLIAQMIKNTPLYPREEAPRR